MCSIYGMKSKPDIDQQCEWWQRLFTKPIPFSLHLGHSVRLYFSASATVSCDHKTEFMPKEY